MATQNTIAGDFEMPIEKRVHGNKTLWRVKIDMGRDESGKRKRVVVGDYPTRTAAKKAMAKAVVDRDGGTLLLPDSTTVNELLDNLIKNDMPKSVAIAQRPSYVSLIKKHIRPALGSMKVRKLEVQHIEALLNRMTVEGYSSSQVTKTRMRVAQALDMAVRYGLVARNVARDAKPPKLEYDHGEIRTLAEIGTFLQAATDDDCWPLWKILGETGCRQSEALGLPWKLIDPEAATFRLSVFSPVMKAVEK